MELLDPTVEQPAQSISFAARPKALAGKRVALIENTKYNSEKLLEKIGDILKKEQGIASFKVFHKHNSSVPAHQEVIDQVKAGYDVMVAGVGD
jgi:diacylglycerol kinase family enzyme